MKAVESEDKKRMFDVLKEGDPVEGCKARGDVVKARAQENDLCRSSLNRDKPGKESVAVTER